MDPKDTVRNHRYVHTVLVYIRLVIDRYTRTYSWEWEESERKEQTFTLVLYTQRIPSLLIYPVTYKKFSSRFTVYGNSRELFTIVIH